MRRFAIGDIHGCSKALRTLIDTIDPQPDDELIFMGDYIDRGPDTRDVVDQIIRLQYRTQVVALRGNHELMLLGVVLGGLDDTVWLENGGAATVASYGGSLHRIPRNHFEFYQNSDNFFNVTPDQVKSLIDRFWLQYEAHMSKDSISILWQFLFIKPYVGLMHGNAARIMGKLSFHCGRIK